MRKRKIKIGDVFKIPLKEIGSACGIVVFNHEVVFLPLLFENDIDITSINVNDFLFRVPVAKDELASGRWECIGNISIPEDIAVPGVYAKKDIGRDTYALYHAGVLTPTDRETARKYEVIAVWFSEHIEERLQSHFEGRPSVNYQSLRKSNNFD